MGRNNSRRFHKRPQQSQTDTYAPPYSEEVLAMSVEGLNLSVETLEILKKGGVLLVRDVAVRRKTDMFKVQNFNKKKLFELQNAIAPLGVSFRPDEPAQAEKSAEQPRGEKSVGEKKGGEDRRAGGREQGERREGNQDRRNERNDRRPNENKPRQNDGRPQQGKKEFSSKNKGNAVDFSKIFPREKLVHSPKIEPEKDRFTKFQKAGKWGFKDENGNVVIPPIYNEALNFKEDMAAVEMNGLFGYINRENELVVPYKYDTAGSFSEGWANVSLGEKCGYIDQTGKETVPFIYDAATPFTGEGYGRVKKDGRWGNIRKDGEVSWQ
ncbi:MAG: WG repeat-containing protein [Clostridia bacterium]|nr:WG repeat-containing protein [Clostridia bacterium]